MSSWKVPWGETEVLSSKDLQQEKVLGNKQNEYKLNMIFKSTLIVTVNYVAGL